MRYNKTLFGYESEVDYPKYFFSNKGKYKPDLEMEASIEAFKRPSSQFKDINQHPACLFPGRFNYLKKVTKEKLLFDLNKCTEFQKFKKKLNASSLAVIFSSYYINKPASAFGHTLLKINGASSALTNDLHSYGVDFSAQVTTSNPLLYGVLGIFGGFYGRFSLLPYFLKLREYNDFESRDLWEFELNLSPQELDFAIAHLWDMNLALFDYYYFTENCSYHIYRFIDAIKPSWKLAKQIYPFPVVPIDTLYPLILDETVTKNIYHRPSVQKRTFQQFNRLNKKQKIFIKDSLAKRKLQGLNKLADKMKQSQALDTLIDIVDYKFPEELHLNKGDPAVKAFKGSILSERSRFDTSSFSSTKKLKMKNIDLGHRSRRFILSNVRQNSENNFNFEHRFALHDYLEKPGDVFSNFSLEMGKFSITRDSLQEKIYLNFFEVAHVLALRPVSFIETPLSWSFSFGLGNSQAFQTSFSPYADVSVGYSFSMSMFNLALFAATEFEHIGRSQKNTNRIGPRILLSFHNKEKLGFDINYIRLWEIDESYDQERLESRLSYRLQKSISFDASSSFLNNKVTKVGLSFYY